MSSRHAQDRRAQAPATVRPFQFRGRFLTALALRLEGAPPDEAFYEALDEQLQQTPQFFAEAPVVLDFANAPGIATTEKIRDLARALRERKLRVFGVQNAGPVDQSALEALGLIPVTAGRDAPAPEDSARRKRGVEKLLPPDNKLITTPIRSGQTVVAERGDLTVVGSVASGAEVVASGSIHVYGALRGRAMAGAKGDETARIFCQKLDAELVAIAGLYQTNETLDPAARNRCAQIYLEDEKLLMEAIA
ncbi:septum site-determining protein MinC [Roseivivax marinus]|uniref:septum site-determining protein MinC n=1 Tax=Roseivivax marinus TaxID=1379903 RepID=UPI00273E9375|nr:septum site-determining protein MinC [Roseivivax marinus]